MSWPRLREAKPLGDADGAADGCDGRVGEQHVDDALLALVHGGEADVGAGERAAVEEPGVLDGQEALGHDAVEHDGADEEAER